MSASEQMRAMLDQLMGTARNGPGAGGIEGVKFEDPKVCKSFLYSCCPHEILASTRMDLGECAKIHEYALRADYEKAALDKSKDYFYDVDACDHLKSFIDDCDRRTELAKKRLAETQEELSAEVTSKAEKVHQLAEEIGKKLADAEQAGAEGKVEESMKLMEEIEEVRKKKALAEQDYRNSMPASSYQQQKLRVCEVCSAYLGIHDNDRRLADHFGGKLHLGFIKIREKLAGLMENYEERKVTRREARQREAAHTGESLFSAANSGFGGFGSRFGRNGGSGGGGSALEQRSQERLDDRRRLGQPHRRSRSRSRERRRRRSRSRSRGDRKSRRSRSRSRDRRRKNRSRSKESRDSRDKRRSRKYSRSFSRSRSRSSSSDDWSRRRSRSGSKSQKTREKRSKSSDRFKDSPKE